MHALVAGAGSDQLILVMITNQIHVCRFTRVFEQEFAQSVKDNLPYKVVEENVQLHIEVKTAKDGQGRLHIDVSCYHMWRPWSKIEKVSSKLRRRLPKTQTSPHVITRHIDKTHVEMSGF